MTLDVIGLSDKHKMTPLHESVLRNNHEILREMVNVIQDTPLPEIDLKNREEQIRACRDGLRKDKSSLLNKKNKEGWTPLHYAADRGHVNVLQVLVMAASCDVTISNKNKQTAFHLAARSGHLDCLQLLYVAAESSQSLDDLPRVDKKGWNLACHASAHDEVKVIEWLLKNMPQHADINHYTEKGYTPLLLACDFQKLNILKFLLNHDLISEIATTTKDGKTALHLAALHDSVEIVQLLLSKDFPIGQDDEKGETALHVAYKKGSHQVWRLLFDEGADPNKKNKAGKCPEDLKYEDLRVPVEVKKRGEKAVEGYIAALRKGKKKMPRCKLMIVGEAGVGKTNLLNLLTGEEFVAKHEETEGVDIDLVSTSDISTDREIWRKSATEVSEEYRSVAVDLVADELRNTTPIQPQKKHVHNAVDGISLNSLYNRFDTLLQKYRKQPNKSKATFSSSSSRPSVSERRRGDKQFNKSAIHLSSLSYQPPPSHVQIPVHKPTLPQPKYDTHIAEQQLEQTSKAVPKEEPNSSTMVHPPPTIVASGEASKKLKQEKLAQSSIKSTPLDSTNNKLQTKISGQDDIVILHEASKKSKQAKSTQSTLPLKLTSFDFAGQKHYKPMHHCFITSRAIYVVAFNARQLLYGDQTVVIQELKFWINSIRVHTNAEVVLVGTHKGPYDGASGDDLTKEEKKSFRQLSKQEMEKIDNLLKKHFDKDHYNLELFEGSRIMALVESSIRSENDSSESGANVVCKKLHHLGDNRPENKDDLPISYLRLEAMITEKRNHVSSLLVHRKEIEQWVRDCDIDECQVALDFFHDIGTLIDPRNLPTLFLSKKQMEPLHDVVLIKLQWLADVMKELMNIDRGDDKLQPEGEKDMKKALRKFENEGKADKKSVMFPLWRKYHNGSEEVFQQICLLLEAYGLIVPIEQSQCYYVPCKLPQNVEEFPCITDDYCNKISLICKDGLFPPFLLHHLMFLMYREQTPSYYLFSDKECFMEYVRDCQWWLKQNEHCDSIDVTIRTKKQVRTILPAMLLLHRLLLRIVKELKEICYKIGMMATCTACRQEQFFTYITYNVNSKATNQNESLQCSKCRNEEQVSPNSTLIKSKNYKYEKTFNGFKEDLGLDQLDVNVRRHLIKYFKRNIRAEEATDDDDDESIIQLWFEGNRDDPWPSVITFLSNYKDSKVTEYIVDKLKHDMCHIY
ncbi:uncharacterized protein [Dysidea avara]